MVNGLPSLDSSSRFFLSDIIVFGDNELSVLQNVNAMIAMGNAIYYRSLHTPEPQNPQKVSKRSSGPPSSEWQKRVEKVPKDPKKESKRLQN